jgi:hypothetical protein
VSGYPQGVFEKPFDFDELLEAIRRFYPIVEHQN